jgi:hypothetical protein
MKQRIPENLKIPEIQLLGLAYFRRYVRGQPFCPLILEI